jgi:hypothetical protein
MLKRKKKEIVQFVMRALVAIVSSRFQFYVPLFNFKVKQRCLV